MYVVPMEIPKYCNKCPFGQCSCSCPSWAADSVSRIDGKRNLPGTYGYTCMLDHDKNKRSTKVMRADFKDNIPRPEWCGLKEAEDM